jgi:Protein of unknown function (DUF732)
MKLLSAVLVAAVAVTLAAPAKADDQSFLDRLAGKNTAWFNPQQLVGVGHEVCTELRGGASPADLAAMARGYDGPAIVDAAQHELCPDTLH